MPHHTPLVERWTVPADFEDAPAFWNSLEPYSPASDVPEWVRRPAEDSAAIERVWDCVVRGERSPTQAIGDFVDAGMDEEDAVLYVAAALESRR